ncbi:MAG: hypothetical protein ABSH56_23160 [Bryobacteraceae bacterium]|jgi:hypothetical protein
MTKLTSDPISPVAMAGLGVPAAEDPGVATVEPCLAMPETTVQRSARAQIEAGDRAMIVCEPAADVDPSEKNNQSHTGSVDAIMTASTSAVSRFPRATGSFNVISETTRAFYR